MNKLTKIFAGLVLAGSASVASADPLFVDYLNDGVTSDPFTSFVFNSFNPTSAYLDLDGSGVIGVGNHVFDSGGGTIVGLSPLAFPAPRDGFGSNWGLNFEYELFGFSALAVDLNGNNIFDAGDDQLAAGFVDGYINFSYSAGGTQIGEVLSIAVTGSAYNINDGLNFTVFGEPISATNLINTVQAFDGMTGLGDLLASPNSDDYGLGAFATLKILDATQAPEVDGSFTVSPFQQSIIDGLGISITADSQWLTRETTIDSSNLYITASSPTNAALMGLCLIGLGLSRRIAKK
jgi:hypothetical protein